ncbi:MAG: hypothetical protein RIR49_1976 [Actinomycetota bacterium]|jgi:decaprenyl-phosphate phosphoribosyltransferase
MMDLVRAARPKQWVKNVLVFAAPGAAGVLTTADGVWRSSLVFVVFCLAASGTYLWNDIADRQSDRQHPTKRRRPIASGAVSVRLAGVVGSGLMVVAVALAAVLGWQTLVVTVVYVAVTLSYSAVFRQVAVLDLVVVASGFVLRAVAGAVAVDVPMSTWFVVCVSFGALFVVTGKRYAEFLELGAGQLPGRATLAVYTQPYLRSMVTMAMTVAIVTYCLWAFESNTAAGDGAVLFEVSIVPLVAAFMRYLLVLDMGRGAAPEEVFASDRVLQALGVVWVVVYGLAVYL